MNRFVTFATVLLLLGNAFPSQAASFDCKKASTETEKLICSDQAVSNLDEQLSIAYKKAVAAASHKEYIREWQRTWLTTRDHCGDVLCLKTAYAEQISELREHAEAASATSTVSGKYKRGNFDTDGSEIIVIELKNKRIRVMGDSTWVGNAATGNVNVGEVNGESVLVGNKAKYKDPENDECSFLMTFQKDGLTVDEDENSQCGGLNVSFDGEYQKVRK